MKLLETWVVNHQDGSRRIELLEGDLARLPRDHAVDVLVVSAFPNDYAATPTSLIGALHSKGLSVAALAQDKQVDLRQQFSCWLSKPIPSEFAFRHVLCVESGWRGSPPELTDDIFRALAPYLLTDLANSSVAMPLIGAGDQGYRPEVMLRAILQAAVPWLQRGMPLRILKIVVHGDRAAERARAEFAELKAAWRIGVPPVARDPDRPVSTYSVFVSYAREQADMASYFVEKLRGASNRVRIFFDQTTLQQGASWTWQVATALDASERVVALYSSDYWSSKNCQMEFLAAFTRQNDTGLSILFPVYLSDANIPYLFRTLQHMDCRISDRQKVARACSRLATELA